MSSQPETTYYEQDSVLVTSQRAEFTGKTFAMANITSVNMTTLKQSHKQGCGYFAFLGFFGIIPLIGGSILGSNSNTQYPANTLGVLGGSVLMLLGFAWIGYNILKWLGEEATYTYSYAVNLTSASGESKAMESSDEQQITAIVEGIKRAIVERDSIVASTPQQRTDSHQKGIPEKLHDLKGLLDAGIITSQEYDAKKTDLLAQL